MGSEVNLQNKICCAYFCMYFCSFELTFECANFFPTGSSDQMAASVPSFVIIEGHRSKQTERKQQPNQSGICGGFFSSAVCGVKIRKAKGSIYTRNCQQNLEQQIQTSELHENMLEYCPKLELRWLCHHPPKKGCGSVLTWFMQVSRGILIAEKLCWRCRIKLRDGILLQYRYCLKILLVVAAFLFFSSLFAYVTPHLSK